MLVGNQDKSISRARLNFFIVGVQKGGTTALHSILANHPDISMSKPKELHFFDNENINWTIPPYDLLERHVAPGRFASGEATPVYSFLPEAIERIYKYNREAKLIMLLRHPSFRAHSQWRMAVSKGWENLPFNLAISDVGRKRVAINENRAVRRLSYVERGFYVKQIEQMLSLFPHEQLLFLRTDRLWAAPMDVLAKIQDFLGVQRLLTYSREYVVPVESRKIGSLNAADKAYLDKLFLSDIQESCRLTKLDLNDWIDPDYVEPMPKQEMV